MDYKTNKYQTALTPELLDSLPKEVKGDLLEAIESIKFVQWLVSPEEVRGYAKDKKRWDQPNLLDERKEDPSGRIYVDITKPHILENIDFFRERAIFFEKNGKYTNIPPNPNPKSAYAEFWRNEVNRWANGLLVSPEFKKTQNAADKLGLTLSATTIATISKISSETPDVYLAGFAYMKLVETDGASHFFTPYRDW